MLKKMFKAILFFALIPFASSLPVMLLNVFGLDNGFVNIVGVPLYMLLFYIVLKRVSKLTNDDYRLGAYVNGIALFLLALIFTVMMIFADGDTSSVIMVNFCWLLFPFAPSMIVQLVLSNYNVIFLTAFVSYLVGFAFCAIVSKAINFKKIIALVLCVGLCVGSSTYMYCNRPSVKYQGHGFDYMNGYSSTDFSDYTVYAKDSKLIGLEHEPSFVIENEEDMPVLDGAEACYPLYSAFAKAVYKNIDEIELGYLDDENYTYTNGKIVSFTNTIDGFDRLVDVKKEYVNSNVDMFFGARPSKEQLEFAKECGVEVEVTPIGKEAFVFFVEQDNFVDDLTSEQIKQIYHGDVDNWNMLGGESRKIVAFQRPDGSGSQTMMQYFMGDISLKEPKQYETVSAMEGVIKEVAQYNNEAGAIGYTFRYFLEGLNQEQGVKMLSIDGVYPTVESVENGSYPLTVDLCLITRKNDTNQNVKRMKDFILSSDGQYIIHQTGYGRLD